MTDDYRADLRRARATQLAAAVMDVLKPFIADDRERDAMRDAHNALFDMFYTSGAEVINDYQRHELGLPVRDVKGWTADELRAWEQHRLEMLMRPMAHLMPAQEAKS